MANKNKKILIAGGGIGGITALLALRQRGIAAELFEQAAAFGQVGAGLQVSGNAMDKRCSVRPICGAARLNRASLFTSIPNPGPSGARTMPPTCSIGRVRMA